MKINGDIIKVKSIPDNFEAEKSYAKRNTYRCVDVDEHKQLLRVKENLKMIKIVNIKNRQWFSRVLTDVRSFEYKPGKWLWIFSW